MPDVDGGDADNGIDHGANQRLVPLLRTYARRESVHASIRIARIVAPDESGPSHRKNR